MASQYVDLPVEGGGSAGVSSLNSLTGALSLVAGSNITITPSGSSITIAASGGGGSGTVTSVALTTPGIFSVSGSPVTTSGTLGISLVTQAANTVWAGPTTGAAANPSFRALVAADIPSLSGSYLPLAGGALTGAVTTSSTIGLALGEKIYFNQPTNSAYIGGGINDVGDISINAVSGYEVLFYVGGTLAGAMDTVEYTTVGSVIPGTGSANDIGARALSRTHLIKPYNSYYAAVSFRCAAGTTTHPNFQVYSGTDPTVDVGTGMYFPNTTSIGWSISGSQVMGLNSSGQLTLSNYTTPGVIVNSSAGLLSSVAPGTSGNVLTSNGTAWVSQAAGGGGSTPTVNTVSSNTNLAQNNVYLVTGPVTLTLPAPSATGGFIWIQDAGYSSTTNTITIAQHGSEKILGVAQSYLLNSNGVVLVLNTNGTDWFPMA